MTPLSIDRLLTLAALLQCGECMEVLDKEFSVLPLTETNVTPKKAGKRKPATTITQPHLFGKGNK